MSKIRSANSLRHFLVKLSLFVLVSGMVLPFVSLSQIQAAQPFSINDIDSYGAQGLTLLQFDGTNPTTIPKASVSITGISGRALNGLALSLTENTFYASTLGTANFYRIAADGQAEFITTLEGVAGNAVIYDGKYYYSYGSGGKPFLVLMI